MGVAGVCKVAVELQQGAVIGRLCLYGSIGRDNGLVKAAPGGGHIAVLVPVDGLAHVLVSA